MTASEPKRNRRKVGDQCKTPEMNSSKREILFGGWLTGFAKKQLSQLWLQFLSFLLFFLASLYSVCVSVCGSKLNQNKFPPSTSCTPSNFPGPVKEQKQKKTSKKSRKKLVAKE